MRRRSAECSEARRRESVGAGVRGCLRVRWHSCV